MRTAWCSVAVLLLGCLASTAQSSSSSSPLLPPAEARAVPVMFEVPTAPTAFRADGQWHLCYELRIANLNSAPLTLESIEVMDPSGSVLQTVKDNSLDKVLFHPARSKDSKAGPLTELAPGETVIAYMWVDVASNANIPSRLQHRVRLQKSGGQHAAEYEAAPTTVLTALPQIMSPLRGNNWVAANGPSNSSGHRRAMIVVDGTPHISQRYAIDWVQAGDDAKTYHGDPKDNHSYYCFGVEAHAVADATVVEVKDGIPENVPQQKPVVPIDLDTIAGNHVNLDLGGGVYAMYAHLQPGSIRVKVGDHVVAGQVLGLVGNTGNSSEPHLHFQLMNANSPLGSEGLPYSLPTYQLVGKANGDDSTPKVDRLAAPQASDGEIPAEDEVVNFQQ